MKKAFYACLFTLITSTILASAKAIIDVSVLKTDSENNAKKIDSVEVDIREMRKDIRDIKNHLIKP